MRKDDAVGCRKHLGTEEGLDLADDHVHAKGVLLEGAKRMHGKLGDFTGLDDGVVVGTLGEDGKHVPLGDKDLHDAGRNV